MRITLGASVVPVEDVLAERRVPPRRRRRERRACELLGGRVGVGKESGLAVARVPRPSADGNLLRIPRIAHDEVV
jgi:hypothetical protein